MISLENCSDSLGRLSIWTRGPALRMLSPERNVNRPNERSVAPPAFQYAAAVMIDAAPTVARTKPIAMFDKTAAPLPLSNPGAARWTCETPDGVGALCASTAAAAITHVS